MMKGDLAVFIAAVAMCVIVPLMCIISVWC